MNYWGLFAFTFPIIVFACVVLVVDPMGAILSLPSDDAFYYCVIARNIVNGAGCTFDGIERTNGFHPLWMLYVVGIYSLAPESLQLPILILIVTNGILCCATLVLLYRIVERHVAPRFGALAVAAALLPNILTAMLNGLETGLQLFAMVLLVRLCFTSNLLDSREVGRRAFALGMLIGVIALCRLDAFFLLGAAALMTIAEAVARKLSPLRSLRRIFAMGAGFGLILLPYFVWNLWSFGHLAPISGTVKSTFPTLRRPLMLASDTKIGAAMIVTLVLLVGFVLLAGDHRKDRWRKTFSSPLVLLTLAALAHFGNVFFFMSWGVYWWHFTIYGLGIVMALVEAAHALGSWRPKLGPFVRVGLIVPLILAAVAMKSHEVKVKGAQHEAWLRAAEWVRDNTPKDAAIAILDAGLFGYFSERRVMNLDGKAGGYEYLDALMTGDVDGYLKRRGIGYIANIRVDYVSDSYGIRIRRPNRPAVVLNMRRDWEVYRSAEIPSAAPRFGAVPLSHFIVWRLPADAES